MSTPRWTSLAGPIQTKKINKLLREIGNEANTQIVLSGTVGVDEHRLIRTTCGIGRGGETIRPEVIKALEELGERFGWEITPASYKAITQALTETLEEFQKSRPVVDERTTPQQDQENREAFRKNQEHGQKVQQQKEQEWAKALGCSGQKTKRQDGEVAIILELCFNNSDIMSDYYDPHAPLSPSFLLELVPRSKAQTERLARAALDRFFAVQPVYKDLNFAWHSETYARGHGNYLQSQDFSIPPEFQAMANVKAYGSDEMISKVHWEVQFTTYRDEFLRYDASGGTAPAEVAQPPAAPEKPRPQPLVLEADRFTATEWATAEDKAKFLKKLTRFVADGFPEQQWTKALYEELRMHWGHIAHYNADGFWGEWFASRDRQIEFLQFHAKRAIYGDPKFTWSDVEREFQSWIHINLEQLLGRELEAWRGQEAGEANPTYKEFIVASVSSNANSFGLKGMILVARDGEAWEVSANDINVRTRGTVLKVPDNKARDLAFSGMSFEIPKRLSPDAPAKVVEEVWALRIKESA